MNATASTRQLRAPRWPAGLVPWRKAVQSFIERLAQAAKVQIQIIGTRVSQSGQQITMIEGTGNGTATSNAVALDRWPQGLRPWKDAVDANLAKISAALHLSTESMQATGRITVEATTPPMLPLSSAVWRDWCKDTERTLEALSRATQRQLQLLGMARASGGDELVFAPPPPPVEVTVELEVQSRTALAFTCPREIVDGVVYGKLTIVTTYEHDTITETQTAAGGVHLHTPSDDTYVCPAVVVESDEEEGLDYGSQIGDPVFTYSVVLDPELLRPAAEAGLESWDDSPDPSIASSGTWMSDTDPPTGLGALLGYWTAFSGAPAIAVRVFRKRYRWKTYARGVDLEWDQGGTSHTLNLDADEVSDWYDDTLPDTEGEADEVENVVITLA
jgi:hypothetical protein